MTKYEVLQCGQTVVDLDRTCRAVRDIEGAVLNTIEQDRTGEMQTKAQMLEHSMGSGLLSTLCLQHRAMRMQWVKPEQVPLPVLAAKLLLLFAVDCSHIDNPLQGSSRLSPFGGQLLAVATPAVHFTLALETQQ